MGLPFVASSSVLQELSIGVGWERRYFSVSMGGKKNERRVWGGAGQNEWGDVRKKMKGRCEKKSQNSEWGGGRRKNGERKM